MLDGLRLIKEIEKYVYKNNVNIYIQSTVVQYLRKRKWHVPIATIIQNIIFRKYMKWIPTRKKRSHLLQKKSVIEENSKDNGIQEDTKI